MIRMGLEPYAKGLRQARLRQGLSQEKLSEMSGVPQAQISRVEAGRVDLRLSSLMALAHALGVEVVLAPRQTLPAIHSLIRQTLNPQADDAELRPAYVLEADDA